MITKTYDLILWSCNHTSKFPRNHRFVLGERIERNLYNLLETLIAAKYTKNRQRLLEEANLTLEVLRFQMRLAKDLQCLKVESYAFAAKSIDEIGRLVGGWLRSRGEEKRMKRHGNLWDRMISFESSASCGSCRRPWQTLQARRCPLRLRSRTPVAPAARGTCQQDLPSRSLPHVHDLRGQDPADQRRPVPGSCRASRLDRGAGADLRAVVHLRQLRLPQGERHPRRRGPLPAVCPPLPLRSQNGQGKDRHCV